MSPVVRHFCLVFLGYAAAVTVSSLVFLLVVLLPDRSGRLFSDFREMYVFGCMLTAVLALPGFLPTLAISERLKLTSVLWFVGAGIFTAYFASVVPLLIGGSRILMWSGLEVAGLTLGGAAGGFAYWAGIGRDSGRWRS